MNPFDFVKTANEVSWMPILIFLIWFVISLFSGARKKKQLQRQREIELGQTAERRAEAPEEPPRKKPNPIEEIRREIEQVFSEERRTYEESSSMEDTEGPAEATEPEPDSYETEPHSYEDASYSYETEPAATAFESRVSQPRPESLPVRPPALTEPVADGTLPQPEAETVGISLGSLDDARKGFLWSEILAPPKALRE